MAKEIYPASRGFFLASLLACTKSFVSLVFSGSQLVYFLERNLCYEMLTFPVEHALNRNQVTVEIMT